MNVKIPNTKKINLILLPGLNGTRGLFSKFTAYIPSEFNIIVLSYPVDKKMGYEELTAFVHSQIADIQGPKYLIGESFSGPISLFLLSKGLKEIKGIVLVASFIFPPQSSVFKYLPWEFILGTKVIFQQLLKYISPKGWFLIGDILNEISLVPNFVLAARIRSILSVDASVALKEAPVPILYLMAERDVLVPKSALQKIKRLKSIEVRTFPTHHFLLQSLPKESWSAIEDFIDRTERLRNED